MSIEGKVLGNIATTKYEYPVQEGVFESDCKKSNLVNLHVYHPSIYLKKTLSDSTIGQGGMIKFSIMALNDGDTNLTGVEFKELFDKQLKPLRNSISIVINDKRVYPPIETLLVEKTDYTVSDATSDYVIVVNHVIEPDEEVVLRITATADENVELGSYLTNTVYAGYSYLDCMTGNITTVSPENGKKDIVYILVMQALLSVIKDVQSIDKSGNLTGISITSVHSRELMGYRLDIYNHGNTTAINVKGVDVLPDELKVFSSTGVKTIPYLETFDFNIDKDNVFTFSGVDVPMALSLTPVVMPGTFQIHIIGEAVY